MNADLGVRILAFPGKEARAANPYTFLLYEGMNAEVITFSLRRAIRNPYHADIFHLHWPESFLNRHSFPLAALKCKLFLYAIDRMRSRGTKVVWTVHNVGSHERRHKLLEAWFWQELMRRIDGAICLSNAGLSVAREKIASDIPIFVIPHGHYRGEYNDPPHANARAQLGIAESARVVLFFGKIRAYKNASKLIDVFSQIKGEDLVLLIVGDPSPELVQVLRNRATTDCRVRLVLQDIPADEVFLYFRSADLVVLPYREILNSGTALLCLSFDRPVLVPKKGAMSELAIRVGSDWVQTFDGELTKDRLRDAIDWARQPRPSLRPDLDGWAWDTIAAQTTQAFQSLINRT